MFEPPKHIMYCESRNNIIIINTSVQNVLIHNDNGHVYPTLYLPKTIAHTGCVQPFTNNLLFMNRKHNLIHMYSPHFQKRYNYLTCDLLSDIYLLEKDTINVSQVCCDNQGNIIVSTIYNKVIYMDPLGKQIRNMMEIKNDIVMYSHLLMYHTCFRQTLLAQKKNNKIISLSDTSGQCTEYTFPYSINCICENPIKPFDLYIADEKGTIYLYDVRKLNKYNNVHSNVLATNQGDVACMCVNYLGHIFVANNNFCQLTCIDQ